MQQLDYVSIDPANGEKAKKLVVFLHGLGADKNDLISIGREWAGALPETAFVSPNAPFACDFGPYGFQWFSLQDRSPHKVAEGVAHAAPILNRFIDDRLKDYGLTDKDLAVVGFSQGTMMSLYAMPRRPKPCAAVVGYSGMLVGGEGLKDGAVTRPAVLLVHGDADDIVSPACLGSAYEGLRAAGFEEVEAIMRPDLAHGIDEVGLMHGASFIREAFDKA